MDHKPEDPEYSGPGLSGGPGRTRTYEGVSPADLQSAPFAARDTDPGLDIDCTGYHPVPLILSRHAEPTMGIEPITYALQEHCSAC